jgi:hypothetical protein
MIGSGPFKKGSTPTNEPTFRIMIIPMVWILTVTTKMLFLPRAAATTLTTRTIGCLLFLSTLTQSHALTCGKSRGSFGQHFRRIARKSAGENDNASANANATIDNYTPSLKVALEALDRFEWFGITELFMPSLRLLHYQPS